MRLQRRAQTGLTTRKLQSLALPFGLAKRCDPPARGPFGITMGIHGSTLSLTIDGVQWKFRYKTPRRELVDMGIRRGTLFFVGQKRGRGYRGMTMVFSRCGVTPYSVSGEISEDGQTILLRGKAPSLDEKCRTHSTWEAIAMLVRSAKQSSAPSSSPP